MSARVIVASEHELPVADSVLAAVGAERRESVESVLDSLFGERPSYLVLDPTLGRGRGLELLRVLEDLDLRIPALIPVNGFADGSVDGSVGGPLDGSPDSECRAFSDFLSPLLMPIYSEEELRGQLFDAVEKAAGSAAPHMFSTWDYVCLGVRHSLTAVLEFGFQQGGSLTVDLVEGEPWNVVNDGEERSLSDLLAAPVARFSSTPLDRKPAQRAIHGPAERTLQYLAHQAGLPVPPSRPALATPKRRRGDTEPIDLEGFIVDAGAAVAHLGSTNGHAASDGPSKAAATAGAEPPEDAKRKSQAATDNAAFAEYWLRRGLEAALGRNFQGAETAFLRALELAPDDPRIHYNLDRVRRAQRRRG